MRTTRILLAGALSLATVAGVCYLVFPGHPADSTQQADARNGANPPAPFDASSTGGKDNPASSHQNAIRNVPWADGNSAFSRRQDLERSGYEAGQGGHIAALKRLAELTAPNDRAVFIRGMVAGLRESGTQEVLRGLRALPTPSERTAALRALAEARRLELPATSSGDEKRGPGEEPIEPIDMKLFAAKISKTRGFDEYSSLILTLRDSPDLAVGLAHEFVKGPELGVFLAEIATDHVSRDPAFALSLGEGLQGKLRVDFLSTIAAQWGSADSSAAWAWAQTQDPATADKLQSGVIRGTVYGNPQAAAQHAAEMAEGPARQRSVDLIGQVWGMKDTQAALEWANTLPIQEERDSALASIRESAPVGIGAVLTSDPDGYPLIQDLVPGGAASEIPQMAKGSRIASVRDASGNMVDLREMKLTDAVSLLRGSPGSAATLEIIPPGGSPADRRTVVVNRRQIIRKE
jgi:hypothetical protein